ncbi:RagB/SusD family nutrient uptake outer membrane protein [Chitinophaga sp. MM2321]|uniref:RagB/SusD family nutrient uptake outer membrane protein n=1 Tax=Chitinophaga sp. MM2321 TaxID=3137178 RepID=UPI0032D5A4B4
MKKIYLLAVCAGFLATGCNKSLLDTVPHDRYTEETFWTTPEAAGAALTGCYSVLRNDGVFGGKNTSGGSATALWEETLSPNAYNQTNTMSFNAIATGQQMSSTGGIVTARYADCYSGIGRCNTFLKKVDEVPGMDAAQVKRMKAEATFLRALYYFTLQNYYGGVPLILDPPDRDAQQDLPRNTREEVITQVLADLDAAAAALPLKYSGTDLGRATKGAAMALKARVLLYEASPLLNIANNSQKWVAAAAAAKAVMDEAGTGYGLFDNYRALFLQPNENNKEVIFDVQYIFPNQGSSFDLICTQYNTNAPLLGLAQAYYTNKGLPISDPASGYDAAHPYLNRDPRLYATFTYPGDVYKGDTIKASRFAITGYGMKKFGIYDSIKPPKDKSDLKDGQSDINFIVLRYADILLMYAEAQNEAVGPDATVYDALDKIRDRAKMPRIPAGLLKDDMRKEIRHERRIELAGEGMYYNDIRRWKTAEKELNADVLTYSGKFIEKRSFDPNRDYWWPIPLGEKDLNPALEQNKGY